MKSRRSASFEPDQMCVLQVPHVYLPRIGGVQIYTFNLSKYLRKKGVHVEVLSTWNGVRVLRQSYFGIGTTWVPEFPNVRGNPLSPILFLKLLKISPDFHLLHAHPPQLTTTFYSALARKGLSNRPLVITSHGLASPDYFSGTTSSLLKLANITARFSLTRADAIIALTDYERSLLLRMGGPDIANRVHVIPNATDISQDVVDKVDRTQSRASLGFDEHFVILFVGVLRWQKGVQYLIEAVKCLRKAKWRLIIAGDGDNRNQLANSIPSSLVERITFMGNVNRANLLPYYAACDALVNPSLHEGFPTVVPEAWMFSKPVILTDIPTHREIINKWKGGMLVKARSAGELAQAIQFAMDNPDTCRKLGVEGYRAACSHLSWAIVGEKILKLYGRVLAA